MREESAREEVDRLHYQEERQRKIAEALRDGEKKDEHRMAAERLSDLAWAVEEESDLDFTPSGLWPE